MIYIVVISIVLLMIYIGIYPSISILLDNKETTKEIEFDSKRHIVNTIAFWGPAIITFCLLFFFNEDFKSCPVIGIPLSVCAALFTGIVGMLIGYKINISNAEALDIKSRAVEEEKLKLKTGIIAGTIGTTTTMHHSKNAIKEILNPDSWKEMK